MPWRASLIGTVAAVLMTVAGYDVRAADGAELRGIFEQLLQDPTNAALNFQYARLAAEAGELRKALAAYERVLEEEPDNVEAQREIERIRRLLKPDITEATLILAYQYEANPNFQPDAGFEFDDHTFIARGQVVDERTIESTRWRSEAHLFADYHKRFRSLDFGNVGVRSGPVFNVVRGLDAYTALGAAYSWLDGETFFVEGSAFVSLEATDEGPFDRLNLRATYNKIGREFSSRDGYRIEVNPRWLFNGLATDGDLAMLNPVYAFNGVAGSGEVGVGRRGRPFPLRSHSIGVRGDYYLPVSRNTYLNANMAVTYWRFSEAVFDGSKSRRDLLLSPGAQVILVEPLVPNGDLIFS